MLEALGSSSPTARNGTTSGCSGPISGPFPNLAPEDVEAAIERFAAGLPAPARTKRLLDPSPLHIERGGESAIDVRRAWRATVRI